MKSSNIDTNLVAAVGAIVLAAQLSRGSIDSLAVTDDHMDQLADLSVRAALALQAAIPRAEAAIEVKAKAAEEEAEAEQRRVDQAAADQKAQDKQDKADAKADAKK